MGAKRVLFSIGNRAHILSPWRAFTFAREEEEEMREREGAYCFENSQVFKCDQRVPERRASEPKSITALL